MPIEPEMALRMAVHNALVKTLGADDRSFLESLGYELFYDERDLGSFELTLASIRVDNMSAKEKKRQLLKIFPDLGPI